MQNVKPIDYSMSSGDIYVNLTCPYAVGTPEDPYLVSAVCPETNATVSVNW